MGSTFFSLWSFNVWRLSSPLFPGVALVRWQELGAVSVCRGVTEHIGEWPLYLEHDPHRLPRFHPRRPEDGSGTHLHTLPLLPLRNPWNRRASNPLALYTWVYQGLQGLSSPLNYPMILHSCALCPLESFLWLFSSLSTIEKTWVSQWTWLLHPSHRWGNSRDVYSVIQTAPSFPVLSHSGCECHPCKLFPHFLLSPVTSQCLCSLVIFAPAVGIVTKLLNFSSQGVSFSKSAWERSEVLTTVLFWLFTLYSFPLPISLFLFPHCIFLSPVLSCCFIVPSASSLKPMVFLTAQWAPL